MILVNNILKLVYAIASQSNLSVYTIDRKIVVGGYNRYSSLDNKPSYKRFTPLHFSHFIKYSFLLILLFSNALLYAQNPDTNTIKDNFFDTTLTIDDIENNPNYIIISSRQEQDKIIYIVKTEYNLKTQFLITQL